MFDVKVSLSFMQKSKALSTLQINIKTAAGDFRRNWSRVKTVERQSL